MIALLSVGGAIRDCVISVGFGFLLGLFYCTLRFCFGSKRNLVFICDIFIFLIGAILFRSTAAGMFEGGIMRWYTAFCVILSYFLSITIFMHLFIAGSNKFKKYLVLPLNFIYLRYLRKIIKKIFALTLKIYKKIHKFNVKIPKKKKRHLQNETKMLYNS